MEYNALTIIKISYINQKFDVNMNSSNIIVCNDIVIDHFLPIKVYSSYCTSTKNAKLAQLNTYYLFWGVILLVSEYLFSFLYYSQINRHHYFPFQPNNRVCFLLLLQKFQLNFNLSFKDVFLSLTETTKGGKNAAIAQ